MTKSFGGKVLLVTGGSRGIGEAVARGYVARGGKVAFVGLEPEMLQAIVSDLGDAAVFWEVDVRDGAALAAAIDRAAAHFGRLDHVLANAGIVTYATLRQTDDDTFDKIIDINVGGVFRTLKAATPHLIESQGHALLISSLIAFMPILGLGPYGASKAAVEALALAARTELAPLGVGVGVVHPGWIDTEMVRGPERDLPTFVRARKFLPYPANSTTSVTDCADAILNGFAKRKVRVYTPRKIVVANVIKPLLYSALVWPVFRRLTGRFVAPLEADIERLGRITSAHAPD